MDENSRKIKLLKLMEILYLRSDEDDPMTTDQLCFCLSSEGIKCDRRTLAKDIEALNLWGYEILTCKVGRKNGYFTTHRQFSIAELRLLADAVMASHLITEKKTSQLTEKLCLLGGRTQSEIIRSSIVRFNSSKCTNEAVYYTIDALDRAVKLKKRVSIVYYHLDEKRNKVYHSENGIYHVQPVALIYNNDNYYLTCYDQDLQRECNFRLDRIERVSVEDEPISAEAEQYIDRVKGYSSRVFGMYGGNTVKVTLEFTAPMIEHIFDKFGRGAYIYKRGENRYRTSAEVQISPVFFSWVFQFTGNMTIISPENVVEEYRKMLASAGDAL